MTFLFSLLRWRSGMCGSGFWFAAMAALLASAAVAQPSDFMGPSVKNLSVGLFCQPDVDFQDESSGTASGFTNAISDVPVHVASTQTISTRLGNTFGVQVRMKNDDHWGTITIRYSHPAFPNDGTTRQDLTTDFYADWNVISYTFDFANEQVEGPWTVEAWSETEQLFRITFDMVSETGQGNGSPVCG